MIRCSLELLIYKILNSDESIRANTVSMANKLYCLHYYPLVINFFSVLFRWGFCAGF